MRKDEIWSVSLEKASEFFACQPDIIKTEAGFLFDRCTISLLALSPGETARWQFPRIRLIMDGPDEDVAVIYRRFMIQFLTAGG